MKACNDCKWNIVMTCNHPKCAIPRLDYYEGTETYAPYASDAREGPCGREARFFERANWLKRFLHEY